MVFISQHQARGLALPAGPGRQLTRFSVNAEPWRCSRSILCA